MTGGNFWIITAGLAKGISSTGFLAGVTADVSSRIRRRFYTWCRQFIGRRFQFWKRVSCSLRTLEGGIAGGLIGGLDALRFTVRVILKVTITLLSILFWLAILCTILLCVLWEARLCKTFHVISSGGYLAFWDSHLFYFPLRALHFRFFSYAPRYAMTRRRMLFPFYPQR